MVVANLTQYSLVASALLCKYFAFKNLIACININITIGILIQEVLQ